MVIAREMQIGQQYRITNENKPHGIQVVEYSHPSNTPGKIGFACVTERGDLDFQSLFGIDWDREVHPIPDMVKEDKCPACGEKLERTNNPDNPVCLQNDSMCSCGWMGNYRR
jgi:hypothetical protein